MATEIELKLLINPADIASLRRHPMLKAHASGRARTRTLFSIYFDTPDSSLRQQHVALRVRRIRRALGADGQGRRRRTGRLAPARRMGR